MSTTRVVGKAMPHKLGNQAHEEHSLVAKKAWATRVALALAVGLSYFLAGQIGLSLLTATERVAVFWPASGIAAGTLIALGPGARGPIASGVIAATVAANLLSDRSVSSALAFGLCNAAEALLVFWLIKLWFGPVFSLDTLRRVVGFFAAAAIATAVAALGAAGAMKLFGPSTATVFDVWEVWFASDMLGIITVAPVLIESAAVLREAPPWREVLEGTLGVAAVAATSGFALALLTGPWSLLAPASFLFPLLLWLGSRCRPVFTAAAAFAVAGTILWAVIVDGDPSPEISEHVVAAQLAMLGFSLTALALAALFDERRRHVVALDESAARLQSCLDAANVIAWDVDFVRNTAYSAGPVRRVLDRPEGPVPRDFAAMAETIHPTERDSVMAQFWADVRNAATFRVEFRLNSDSPRWVTAEGTVEHDAYGQPARLRGITHDITERKKAQAALGESEARYRALYHDNPSMYFTVDASGTVLSVNEFGARQLGYTPADLVGQSVLKVIHQEDHESARQYLASSVENWQTVATTELRKVDRDGKVIWVREVARAMRDPGQERTILLLVCEDITERKRVEEQQLLLMAELDHRVKNTLATVSAVVSQTKEPSGSIAQFVAALDGRIHSMAKTHELLSSRQWHGVSLAELVRCELAPYATAMNTEIGGPEVTLSAKASQALSMVLHELATNAAKHGALSVPDGQIRVRWHRGMNGDAGPRIGIEWHEKGGPGIRTPGTSGFGMEIIRDLIPYELGGMSDLVFSADGLRCRLEIPEEWLSNGTRGMLSATEQPLHTVT
jgi:PAS domain S-box-containing protein